MYRNPSIHFATFVFGIIFSILILLISSYYPYHTSMYLKIVAFFIFVVCSALSVEFELSHPFVWFNIPFMLYSLSTPILYLLGAHRYYSTYLETINLEYIAIVVFSVVIGHHVNSYEKMKLDKLELLTLGNKWFFIMSLSLALIYLTSLVSSEITSKYDKVIRCSPLFLLDFSYYFLNISLSVYLIDFILNNKSVPVRNMSIFMIFLVVSFLICGERDILFRFVLMFLLIYHLLYKKVKKRYLFCAFFAGVYLSTILGAFKMYLLSGEVVGNLQIRMDFKSIIITILSSEFRTASRNLVLLLENVPNPIPFFMGKSILWDLQRAIIPGFLFPRSAFSSAPNWLSETFFWDFWKRGGGVGFTMVGVGYLNFGVIGVVCLFLVLGIVVKTIYNFSSKKLLGYILYINFIPMFIYSIRGSLAMPISQSIKHMIFPLIVIVVFGKIKKEIFNLVLNHQREVKTTEKGALRDIWPGRNSGIDLGV